MKLKVAMLGRCGTPVPKIMMVASYSLFHLCRAIGRLGFTDLPPTGIWFGKSER